MMQIKVQFLTAYPPYAKGEFATFPEREANRLIDRGFAMYAGGDQARETAADRLKAIRQAPRTMAIPGPAPVSPEAPSPVKIETKATTPAPRAPRASSVEGKGKNTPSKPRTRGKSGTK